jgi:aubergine-like protein
MNITTNHFHVQVENFEEIHIFSLHFAPKIPYDNAARRREVLDAAMPALRAHIDSPVVSGSNLYSTRASSSEAFEVEALGYRVAVKEVKVLKVKENPKVLLSFLNNGLRSIMRRLNYIEIGRSGKYFNASEKTHIDNLMMFSGYRSNFVLLENGFYLRVDSAKKIVRNQTVLQAVDEVYKYHQEKEKEERRAILQGELVGKIVMTNYGKTSYHRIEEVVFQELDSVHLQDANMSLREYYQTKYNITIRNPKQPLLRVESKRRGNKDFQIYLLPELCLMTGIPDSFDEFRRKKISENTIKSAD